MCSYYFCLGSGYITLINLPCVTVFVFCDSSPAVSKQPLEDVRGPWRAEDGPLDTSVFEVAAVDLVRAKPLLDSLLDTVTLRKTHRARSRGETVIHKVDRVLNKDDRNSGS